MFWQNKLNQECPFCTGERVFFDIGHIYVCVIVTQSGDRRFTSFVRFKKVHYYVFLEGYVYKMKH